MEFSIEFYESAAGRCPVREFLDALQQSDLDDFAVVLAGLDKLKHRAYHRPPLSKAIGDGLFELRHVGKLNTRVFYFFRTGCRIVAVHGVRNKGQTISPQERRTALERMLDWQERMT